MRFEVRRLALSLGLLLLMAAPAAAQDVIEIGRRNGVEAPEWVRERLAQDPTAFEFRRAWKSELAAVRAARSRLERQGLAPLQMAPAQAARVGAAVTGTYKVPTVAVLYSNTAAAPYPAADLQSRLYSSGSASLSLTDYYSEQSRGVLTMTGTVTDWARVSQNDTYYEGSDNGDRVGELLQEALDAVDPDIDFSAFDRDGDGYVDFIAFVHPEEGGECGTANIWSHRFSYEGATGDPPYVTDDGVKISDYVIQPAYNCGGTDPIDIGVFAHEYGHALGLPDLYATDYSNAGIDVWGLMGAGNDNRADSPAHMMAWSKAELGWIPVTTISRDTAALAIEPAATTGEAIRIDIEGSAGEYFLLENRQALGSDQHLLGTGLLIWHIDSTRIASRTGSNSVQNDAAHKGIDLEEADGLADLDQADGAADGGDPYPGSTGRTRFDRTSNPHSGSYGSGASGIAITSIAQSGTTITLDIGFDTSDGSVVYYGDVDENGTIDADDALQIYLAAIGAADSVLAVPAADVDGDGTVGVRDAFIVHSYVEGVDVSDFRIGSAVSSSSTVPLGARKAPEPVGEARTLPVVRTGGSR